MDKDPFTPAQKAKMKCNSDRAIFYKEAMTSIYNNFRFNRTFEFDLHDLNFRACETAPRIVWTYYQDSDGNMHRVKK